MFTDLISRLYIFASSVAASQTDCDAEKSKKLLGLFPKWYAYFPSDKYTFAAGRCGFSALDLTKDYNLLWLVILAAIEILLRVAGLVAVVFVIYGGFRYITSQGEPENTKAALNTIINALIGVAIAVVASAAVAFIASHFS